MQRNKEKKKFVSATTEEVERKEIDENDLCPICQEDLISEDEPVTYCRRSCGNNIHVKVRAKTN